MVLVASESPSEKRHAAVVRCRNIVRVGSKFVSFVIPARQFLQNHSKLFFIRCLSFKRISFQFIGTTENELRRSCLQAARTVFFARARSTPTVFTPQVFFFLRGRKTATGEHRAACRPSAGQAQITVGRMFCAFSVFRLTKINSASPSILLS